MSSGRRGRPSCVAEVSDWCRVSVGGPGRPTLDLVDALARLQLCIDRAGGRLALTYVSADLADLLELAGLTGEVGRQAEEGEEQVGGQEEVHGGNPVA